MAVSILKGPKVYEFTEDFFVKSKLYPLSVLDKGMCGDIILASHTENPELMYIVKKFCMLDEEKAPRNQSIFIREVKIMQSVDHPFVTKCIFATRCPGYLAFCMNYYQRRTLNFHVDTISLKMAEYLTLQVGCALRYLHKYRLVHLDVKLDNVFVDNDCNAILGDFGLAMELQPTQVTVPKKHIGGTPGYHSPEYKEVSEEVELDPYKIDAYSLGVVLWAMVSHIAPEEGIFYLFETRRSVELPAHIRDMLLRLLEENPAKRVNVYDFLSIAYRYSVYKHVIDQN